MRYRITAEMAGSNSRGGWSWICAFAGVCVFGLCAFGQDDAVRTLRAYVNTVQVPVLVLGPRRERLKTPIDADRFYIDVDLGPRFKATHVRREGEDQISLAVLLDPSGESGALMPEMSAAMASLAPEFLHKQDRTTIYAMDCQLLHVDRNVSSEAGELRHAVDDVFAQRQSGLSGEQQEECKKSLLRDSLVHVISDLRTHPGRKVILMVTDGHDEGSGFTWSQLREYAQEEGITVFAVVPANSWRDRSLRSSASPLSEMCELTGGVVQSATTGSFGKTAQDFVTMLRERYIVEFPRPWNSTRGTHQLEVKIDKANRDVIRPAGVSMSLPDPEALKDPNTIASDPTKTPQMGNWKILTPR